MVRECKGEPAAGDIAPVAINSHPIVRVGEDGSLSRCKDTVDTLRFVLAALLFCSCELGKTVEEGTPETTQHMAISRVGEGGKPKLSKHAQT